MHVDAGLNAKVICIVVIPCKGSCSTEAVTLASAASKAHDATP